jgi:hypothetical protein
LASAFAGAAPIPSSASEAMAVAAVSEATFFLRLLRVKLIFDSPVCHVRLSRIDSWEIQKQDFSNPSNVAVTDRQGR